MDNYETIWSFATARFRVELGVAEEDMDPADLFDLPEDIELARSGEPHDWFQARVAVYLDGEMIGADYLGGCSYSSFEDFYQCHRDPDASNRNCSMHRTVCHYFPEMVREAVAAARQHINRGPRVRSPRSVHLNLWG